MDGIRNEYQLGGATHFGASYQHGFGNSSVSYFAYETQLEGRLPVSRESSAFVGQANFELTRERHDSSPIPFYMLPHIGGSSTLRGFALDRFYGRNLALLSLEYRYRIHPFVQVIPFFDEGQIFYRSEDLSWLNWHRNYGLGFRFRSQAARLSCAWNMDAAARAQRFTLFSATAKGRRFVVRSGTERTSDETSCDSSIFLYVAALGCGPLAAPATTTDCGRG